MKKTLISLALVLLLLITCSCADKAVNSETTTAGEQNTTDNETTPAGASIDGDIQGGNGDTATDCYYLSLSDIANEKTDMMKLKLTDFPVYVNKYPGNQAGPTYEITPEMTQGLKDSLITLLNALGIDDVSESYNDSEGFRVLDKIDGVEYISSPSTVSIVLKGVKIDDIAFADNKYVSALLSAAGITDPETEKTVEYTSSGRKTTTYTLAQKNDDAKAFLEGRYLKNVVLKQSDSDDTLYLSAINKTNCEKANGTSCKTYDEALSEVLETENGAKLENLIACTVEYSFKTVEGFFVPCYRFSFSNTKATENVRSNTEQDIVQEVVKLLNAADVYSIPMYEAENIS